MLHETNSYIIDSFSPDLNDVHTWKQQTFTSNQKMASRTSDIWFFKKQKSIHNCVILEDAKQVPMLLMLPVTNNSLYLRMYFAFNTLEKEN